MLVQMSVLLTKVRHLEKARKYLEVSNKKASFVSSLFLSHQNGSLTLIYVCGTALHLHLDPIKTNEHLVCASS